MIPKIDIDPPPGPVKMGDPAKDDIPTITIPMVRPGPEAGRPAGDHRPDEGPAAAARGRSADHQAAGDRRPAGRQRADDRRQARAVPAAPDKRDTYNEDWHAWKDGDSMALISQEYYHDAKYAAALDAYNKEHRKPGDKYVRVPDLWKLEELFPNLIRQGRQGDDRPDPPDRPRPPEARTTGNAGIKFEPVAPLPSGGRAAPPPVTSRARDEYRVSREAGETIREVAQKALGDGNAWKKLYELNPGIDPTLPLPGRHHRPAAQVGQPPINAPGPVSPRVGPGPRRLVPTPQPISPTPVYKTAPSKYLEGVLVDWLVDSFIQPLAHPP